MKWLLLCLLLLSLLFVQTTFAEPRIIDLDTMTAEELSALKTDIETALRNLSTTSGDILTSASRKEPARVGQTVEMTVNGSYMNYVFRISLLEVYRGDTLDEFFGDKHRAGLKSETGEYIAVRFSMEFMSYDNLDTEKAKTDDPELYAHANTWFKAYSGEGTQIMVPRYDVPQMPKLANTHEGGTTDGYFYFEVEKSDSAPYIVYAPPFSNNVEVWFVLN